MRTAYGFSVKIALASLLFCATGLFAQDAGASPQNAAPPASGNASPDVNASDGGGAKSAGTNAGGKWLEFQSEDKMTGRKNVRFELDADKFLRGAEARPRVILFCVGGKLKLGDFRPNVRIAPPNRASFIGRPQLKVRVRVDNSNYSHNWNWVNGNFLAMDEDTVRKLIASTVFKIQFSTPDGPRIAEFSPSGLDLAKVKQDCSIKPEKP